MKKVAMKIHLNSLDSNFCVLDFSRHEEKEISYSLKGRSWNDVPSRFFLFNAYGRGVPMGARGEQLPQAPSLRCGEKFRG